MNSVITFHIIVKYVLIFMFTYMFLYNINIQPSQLSYVLFYVMTITIVFDIFSIDNFYELIQQDTLI